MIAQEAVTLCRMVAAMCPSQAFDAETPKAWAVLLDDVRFADATDAVKALGKRQRNIAPSEVIAEVRRIRGKRLADHAPVEPPAGLTPPEYDRWLRDVLRRIGDGETLPTPRELSGPERHAHRTRLAQLMAGKVQP